MCNLCDVERGEERLGYTFAPSMCWSKIRRLNNGMLQLVFGYGEDPNDTAWCRLDYCPRCGEKQEVNQ